MILPQILSYLLITPCSAWFGTQFRRCNQSSIWSGQISWMGKVVANGLHPIEVLRFTRFQNQVSLYTPIHYAWPYPTGCRPLSLLGVSLPDDLNWKPYILNTTNKANLALGFVKRNLHNCPQKVKDQAYKSLVRPRLEHGCTVWDPYRAY